MILKFFLNLRFHRLLKYEEVEEFHSFQNLFMNLLMNSNELKKS